MKPLKPSINEENHSSDSGSGGGQETVSGQGVGGENDAIGVHEGSVGSGVEPQVRAPFKPKGSSITLTGFGNRDGSDVNNSMDLATFYKFMLGVKP